MIKEGSYLNNTNEKSILSICKEGLRVLGHAREQSSGNACDATCLQFTFIANIILSFNKNKNLNRSVYLKAAQLYHKAMLYCPVYAYKAYYYYQKAGYWGAASASAAEYANYCKNNKVGRYEYWQDMSERSLALYKHSIATNKGKVETKQEEFDIDAALNFIEGNSSTKIRRKKERKTKTNKQTLTGELTSRFETEASVKQFKKTAPQDLNSVKIKHQSSDYLHLSNHEITALSTKSAKKLRLKEHNSNKHIGATKKDFDTTLSSKFYEIKPSCLKTLKPKLAFHQKLLERFWDSKIQQTLNSIRHARIEANIDKEKQIYSEIMSKKGSKKLVGIERIWEERAWTELHQFDDFFSTGILTAQYKAQAKNWIKVAKESYILPALARCLNVDHFRSDVEPEEIWKLANALVESEELQSNKDDNNSIRFRLRCLFSTMGHIYSLLAMVEPVHYRKFSTIARNYFSYKSIDLVYVQN